MIKYLSLIAISLGLLACQSEQDQNMTEQAPQDNLEEQFEQQASPEIDVSDEELETFVKVSGVAQQIQTEAQSDMVAIVEEEDLSVETYNIIAESRYNEQSDDQLDVTQEELDKFEAASDKIGEMERDLDQKVAEAVEEEGMSMDKFMEINMALQQDPSLQERVQQMMMESQSQQQQQANPEGF
ncbi:MAG: DUF4168 domain-containing protein [Rhodohalobacter sp.]|uniref:DUF4168 domain-containing protein n=1 Tax=Rhodohalobacter sp. TaxID=1974210 RepID=UPI00397586CF